MKIVYFAMNNPIISAVITAVILGIGKWGWQRWCNHRDSKSIYDFLINSKSETGFTFRSAEAIASNTKLTEERVETICSRHPKIRRNEKEKQSWTLID